ncbi:MAG: NifB/NifX family molybdenum-iron cluster-binding protein [Syntrophobacteria bacterium]
MKIAVSATGKDLDAQVDQRFGRCRYFILAEPATGEFEAIQNKAATRGSGAGIQTAQLIANAGAEAVITGNVGPNAVATLEAAGLRTYLGASGSVRDALQQYQAGRLRERTGSGAETQAVTGIPFGQGSGRGKGRGRGRGGGGRGRR